MTKKRFGIKSVEGGAMLFVIGNMDLLFEIFLRLPAKSLIRFKSVSKSWLSLISDPEFSITHTQRNIIKLRDSELYFQNYGIDGFIPLGGILTFPATTCLYPVPHNDRKKLMIAHSCCGLILFMQLETYNALVLNPTTQKFKLLMVPSHYLRIRSKYSEYFLAFEPLKSHHYKVVILCCVPDCKKLRFFIFSSKSGSWKKKSATATQSNCCTRKIYLNGAIHWLNEDNFHLQFDVDAEKLIETPLPPKPRILNEHKNEYFGESDGRLFLIQCHRTGALGFRMLEMDTNTHTWVVKHQVNLRPLALQFPELQFFEGSSTFAYSVLYVKSGADRKSFSLVIAMNGKVVLYEVKKGQSNTNISLLCNFPHSSPITFDGKFLERWSYYAVHPLIPCLVPV